MNNINDTNEGQGDKLDELSKDTLKSYVPKRIEKTRGLGNTNYDKAHRIVNKDLPRAMKKLKDPEYNKLYEFAPPSGDDGDDGFSDETLKRLAAQWYNGDEDPRVEKTLMAAGWEIGQDEGYDDEPGVFVVRAGDVNGNSYMSWPADELRQGMAEGLGKDIKRLATGKDVKSRAGQEIAKSQDASMKGDTKTSKKHFDRYDKLDKLANKEQGVAEGDK